MPYKNMVQYPLKSGEKKSPSSFIGSHLSPLSLGLPFHTKINKKKLQNKKIPLKTLKLHPHHGQKERKKEERGEGGGGRERRSQKNSKEKIGCQFYELKPSNSIPTLTKERERERESGGGDLKRIQRRKMVANFMKVSEKERKKLTKLTT
jgi:hypothetical protein